MIQYSLKGEQVTKTFGRRLIFKDINFNFENHGIFGIAGHNGSGKSTLVKIICGVLSPTKGKIIHFANGKKIEIEELHNYIGFVAPYLILYDEFSGEENLLHFCKIRGINYDKEKAKDLFEKFAIYDRRNDAVKGYSSGMKQRLKYIFALLHSPQLLILDEPTSNLDNAGKDAVYSVINETGKNSIVIVASNEDSDLSLCQNVIKVEEFGNVKM